MVQSTEEVMEAAAGRSDSDEALVSRFQQGDASAFDELARRHRRAVYRLAYRLLGTHDEADDVSQEVFLRVYRGLRRFRGESSFRTWIVRIVLNLTRSARRARRAFLTFDQAGEIHPPRRRAGGSAQEAGEAGGREAPHPPETGARSEGV
jgi:DNA-directed RNA polymerase specialized sigma24 family protein